MKLIYIANARMPTERAHGWQIMKMCEAFADRGIDLTLLVPRRWRNPYKGDPFDFYKVKRSFKIKFLPCVDILSFIKGEIVSIIAFKIQAATFGLSALLYCLPRRAETIFSRDHFSAFLLSLFDKKVVLEIHDSPRLSLPMIILFKKLKGLVSTNKWKALEAERTFNFPGNKILVSYNAVNPEEFQVGAGKEMCRKSLQLPSDKKIIVYSGHLYKWKGAEILAQAAKNLPDNFLTVFVGGTKRDIEDFKEHISDKVRVVGYKPHSQVPYFLCSADAVVVPNSGEDSIGRYETSPLKLFEYMASSRPIIASDLPSIREVLDEETATLVPPDDSRLLTQAIIDAVNNMEKTEEKVQRARLLVEQYTWENRAKLVLEFINK